MHMMALDGSSSSWALIGCSASHHTTWINDFSPALQSPSLSLRTGGGKSEGGVGGGGGGETMKLIRVLVPILLAYGGFLLSVL